MSLLTGKRLLMLVVSVGYLGLRAGYRSVARLAGFTTARPAPVVLTYHAVRRHEVGQFERQMQALSTRLAPVFADETPASTRPAVAVTFDDAFESTFENALPIMARYRVPATVFVPTGYLGAFPGWMSGADRSAGTVVSAAALAASNATQVRVASHTVSHPHLTHLEPSAIRAELSMSKQALEGITGAPVSMMSLPFGSFNRLVLAEAAATGYTHVFANVPVRARPAARVSLMGRVNVTPRDWRLEFRLKSLGAYDWMALALPVKRATLALAGKRLQA